MRADRLLSLLMLLQVRGRMSAGDLARELSVSRRTIYRDVEALSMAGVPVYGERGRDGGYSLLDSYRTRLTGLNASEVRALFMTSIPQALSSALSALGSADDLQRAWRKLAAALSEEGRAEAERTRQRIYLDWSSDAAQVGGTHHLQAVREAVWQDRRLAIGYHTVHGVLIEKTVDAYGLVGRAGRWYLVSHDGRRIDAHALSELESVAVCAESFQRPADFDLARWWQNWRDSAVARCPGYRVTLRMRAELLPQVRPYLCSDPARLEEEGWLQAEMIYASFFEARTWILGYGGAAEVLAPQALRWAVADYARQVGAVYAEAGPAGLLLEDD